MAGLLQSMVSGFIIGGVYGAVAAGLAIIYGVMRIINFAHGELVMIGMFIAFWSWTLFGIDPYLSSIFSGLILFALGYVLQKGIINFALAKSTEREPLSVLLITAGISMILINGAILLWTDYPRMITTSYVLKSISIGVIRIPVARLISFVFSLTLVLALYFLLTRTEIGREMRATSQDREAAKLMGINQSRIYCLAFAIGSAIAGMSGAVLAPMFFIKASVGHVFIMKSFVIVVLGGMGSIPGALVGGVLVGLIESVGSQFVNPVYAQASVFVLFILFLLIRPSGILGSERI